MRGYLLSEHPRIAEQRRPGAAAAVGVKAVDDDHPGPDGGALDLGGSDTGFPAAEPEPPEGDTRCGAVQEVKGRPDKAPVPLRERRPDQADVGVRRPEEAPEPGLGGRPDRRGGDAGKGGASQRILRSGGPVISTRSTSAMTTASATAHGSTGR